jgi:hypothetical protein
MSQTITRDEAIAVRGGYQHSGLYNAVYQAGYKIWSENEEGSLGEAVGDGMMKGANDWADENDPA